MSTDILKILQDRVHEKLDVPKHTIKWPSDIAVCKDLNEGSNKYKLRLNENGITTNMQSDNSAFESWSLILKSWLEQGEDLKIELEWDKPLNPKAVRHYQRFLYRVINFSKIMADWFGVSDGAKKHLSESEILTSNGYKKNGTFLLNKGNKDARNQLSAVGKDFYKLSENDIEKLFVANKCSLLECTFGKSDIKLMRQLPVGVFKGEVNKNTSLFTGGKSAIDLWALDNGKAAIFELKKPEGNKKVGSISELLFYSNVIRDLQEDNFQYKKPGDDEDKLKNATSVDGYLLLFEDNIHPLLNNEKIFKLLNNAFQKRNQNFGCIVYNENLKCTKVF